MTTLTEKQAKWLKKAIGDRIQMQRIYVAEFEGRLYAATTNEYNAICVNEQLGIWLDYRSYYDATHHNGQCEMRMQNSTKPVRFDYQDGSLAVVGPMNKEKMK